MGVQVCVDSDEWGKTVKVARPWAIKLTEHNNSDAKNIKSTPKGSAICHSACVAYENE